MCVFICGSCINAHTSSHILAFVYVFIKRSYSYTTVCRVYRQRKIINTSSFDEKKKERIKERKKGKRFVHEFHFGYYYFIRFSFFLLNLISRKNCKFSVFFDFHSCRNDSAFFFFVLDIISYIINQRKKERRKKLKRLINSNR